jgi:hypothetical protein
MKRIVAICSVLLALGLAREALALPDHSTTRVYLDETGWPVGWSMRDCWGDTYSGGTVTASYEIERVSCNSNVPYICSEPGVTIFYDETPLCWAVLPYSECCRDMGTYQCVPEILCTGT